MTRIPYKRDITRQNKGESEWRGLINNAAFALRRPLSCICLQSVALYLSLHFFVFLRHNNATEQTTGPFISPASFYIGHIWKPWHCISCPFLPLLSPHKMHEQGVLLLLDGIWFPLSIIFSLWKRRSCFILQLGHCAFLRMGFSWQNAYARVPAENLWVASCVINNNLYICTFMTC